MRRYEVALDVEPFPMEQVPAIKDGGHRVFKGPEYWKIVSEAPVLGPDSVRAQAHVLVTGIIREFGLTATTSPPTYTLRDPDAGMDDRPDLVLKDNERAYSPDPLTRPPRKWWQRAMELGLGERKGD